MFTVLRCPLTEYWIDTRQNNGKHSSGLRKFWASAVLLTVIGTTADEFIRITFPRGARSQSTRVKICATRDRELSAGVQIVFGHLLVMYMMFVEFSRLKPTRCIVDILLKAYRQCEKADVEKRSYVYKSIWQTLKNQDKLPSGKLVYFSSYFL
ncbi:hypothetical protein RvY_11227 [Ramazzottius varieornatus]|uniref:Uncharacterized protein n=1 Tax=Ramazzottius varieornatus TaxID=947166 RepID=A0A1D1VFF3_RAMVA|nr:hypothetical protein RvY_11227 [Ramazzottius varieornatus]